MAGEGSIQVNIPSIIKKMQLAQAVLDEKALLDFTSNLVFWEGRLFAGNDKMAIISPVPFNLDFSVNGADFYKAVETINGDAILTLENQSLSIKSDKVEARLSVYDSSFSLNWLESTGLINIENWLTIPENFITGANWCKFSTSKDISVRPLTCIRTFGKYIYATDNYRVSRFTMSKRMPDLLIPKENIEIILRFPEVKEYTVIKNENGIPIWVCFRDPETDLVCGSRLVSGFYPSLEKINGYIDKIQVKFVLAFPAGLKEQVVRAGKFVESTTEETASVTVKVGVETISVLAEKPTGSFEQRTPFSFEGKPFSFTISPTLLSDILNKVYSVSVSEYTLLFQVDTFSHIMSYNLLD